MIKDILNGNEEMTPNSKEITVLKEHFPSCFKNDGTFDIERFKSFLSDKITVTDEGYELKFLGKNYARLLASVDTTTVIKPNEEHNSKPENKKSENIYISGDNLDGIKHLLKSYSGEIKCIYIDPPYNTGTDGFIYNDNFNFTTESLSEKLSISEEQAERILDLAKRGSSSHSAWLMFMYPRLVLARDLLTEDGVIFISIDDNEQSNLKIICDDVFGEENFISQIIVQSNKRGQTYKDIAKTHEYILVYAKSSATKIAQLDGDGEGFSKEDSIGGFSERELRNRNPKFGKFNRPNLFYPIYVNLNEIDENEYYPISLEKSEVYSMEVFPLNSKGEESCWRWGKERLLANSSKTTRENNVVAKLKTTGMFGIYEKYRNPKVTAKTIWFDNELYSYNRGIWDETEVIYEKGSVQLREIGLSDYFSFPKPLSLLEKCVQLGVDFNDDAVVLDFFSGSATTAHAVMNLNAKDDGNRKYIMVQLPEIIEEGKPAYEAGYKTIDQIGMDRIIKAANKIKEENPDTEADLGFKHFTLGEPTPNTLDKIEVFDPNENKLFADKTLIDEFGKPTILSTWLVRDGYGLTVEPEELDLSGYKGYFIDKHLYLIDTEIPNEAIEDIVVKYETDGSFNPENIVMFGYSFTWTQMEQLKTNLKRLKDTEKNLNINFDVRY